MNIVKEIRANETVDTLETVLFTNIVEKQVKAMPLSAHAEIISFIACEFNLNLVVSDNSIYGNAHSFKTARRILINCVKNN